MLDPESGLYYYGGRYYDPELGRFISPDPFVAQPSDPQSLNRYSYVENNPVNKIDPSGYKSFWKKVGKALKGLFKKPGVFFATLGLGLVTGGMAWAAAPATWTALQAGAFAGAIGGMTAGAAGAAMTGGNIWQGALLGFAGGAVGGAVAGSMGGGIGGYLAGAFAGGAAAGGLSTAFYGGNFFENMLVGGTTSFAVASGFGAAWFLYNKFVGYDPTWKPGEEVVEKGDQTTPKEAGGSRVIHIGEQGPTARSWVKEGCLLCRFLNRICPGCNSAAGFHDTTVTRFPSGTLMRDYILNFPTMPLAVTVTYGALLTGSPAIPIARELSRDRRND